MSVLVEKLKTAVVNKVNASDKVVIVSGFATPDTVEDIAKSGVETIFYYGMYRKHGLTKLTLDKLRMIHNAYSNLTVKIVYDYHVHTKCYLFYKSNQLFDALVGSANCSIDGLSSGKNSEMLVEINTDNMTCSDYYISLDKYIGEVDKASVLCDDPSITVTSSAKKKTAKVKKGEYPQSSNPFVAFMPLYSWEKNKSGRLKKVVKNKSGLNWGLQSGHSKKGAGYAEAYIKVTGELIDNHPLLFPFFPESRKTSGGKSTRRYDPVTVLWDDGTLMEMIFSGNGVERPTKTNRSEDSPYQRYPKQFTSGSDTDGGGAELGEYLRKRMNVSQRHKITYQDLKDYGRDYIELTYIHDGYYEADFSGHPFLNTRN